MLKRVVLFTLIFPLLCLSFQDPIRGQARSGAHAVRLNRPLKKELNLFFSKFSQTNLPPFDGDRISDAAIISFAIEQVVFYNYKLVENLPSQITEGTKTDAASGIQQYVRTPCIRLPSKHVEATIEEYFGLEFRRHQSVPSEEISYRDGYYFSAVIGCAMGEGSFSFSRITKLLDIGGGKYVATINVYAATEPAGDVEPPYAPEALRKAGSEVELLYRMKATIRKVTSPSGTRYVLIGYQKITQLHIPERAQEVWSGRANAVAGSCSLL